MVCWGVGGAKGGAKRVFVVPPRDPPNHHADGAEYEIESLTALSDASFVVRVSGLSLGAWVTWTMLTDLAVDGAWAGDDGADGHGGRPKSTDAVSGGGRSGDFNIRDDGGARGRRGEVVTCTRCLTTGAARFITASRDLIFAQSQPSRLHSGPSVCMWNIHPSVGGTSQRDGAGIHGLGASRGAPYRPIKVSVCTYRSLAISHQCHSCFFPPFFSHQFSAFYIFLLIHLKAFIESSSKCAHAKFERTHKH